MAQGPDLTSADVDGSHIEEFDFRRRAAIQFLNDLPGVRTLNLIAVTSANHRFSPWIGRRPVVLLDFYIVSARFGMELDPTCSRRASDKHQFVRLQVKQDSVANHMAVVTAGSELLGSVDRELFETIEAEMRSHLNRIRTIDVDVRHVVGLVEKNASISPRALFIPPVRVFGGNDGIDIGAYRRIT